MVKKRVAAAVGAERRKANSQSGYVPPICSPLTKQPSGPGTMAVAGDRVRTTSIRTCQPGQLGPGVLVVPPPSQNKNACVTGWQQPIA